MNEEFVSLNSLYAITDDNEVHLINCKDILDKGIKVNKVYKNIDDYFIYHHFDTKSKYQDDDDDDYDYYYGFASDFSYK